MTFLKPTLAALLVTVLGAAFAVPQDAPVLPPGTRFGAVQGRDGAEHAANMKTLGALAKQAGECAMACDMGASHCIDLLAEGNREHADRQRALLDCATVCSTMACCAARGGPYSAMVAACCAEVSAACATRCEAMPSDPMMKKCAEQLRALEKSCRDCCKAAPAASGS